MWGEGKKLHPALSGGRDNSAQTPFLCRSLGSPICGMGERETGTQEGLLQPGLEGPQLPFCSEELRSLAEHPDACIRGWGCPLVTIASEEGVDSGAWCGDQGFFSTHTRSPSPLYK